MGLGDYDQESGTAALRLTATPKTLTEETVLYFVLSPMASSENTLDQTITAEGRIPAEGPSSGAFTAQVQVPMVQDFAVSVLLEQDGVQYTEMISQQYGFSSMYVCTLTAAADTFCWESSGGRLTVSGAVAVSVDPAVGPGAPQPDSLTARMYIDGEEVYTEEFDVHGEFFSDPDSGQLSSVSGVTYHVWPSGDSSYPCSYDPSLVWTFTLTDTAGNVYEDTISWG